MHEGHRIRMKGRFIRDGIDGFELHEVLEILLYYAVPRRNTNELAHNLMKAFGSISAVFDAPIGALLSKNGVGLQTATLIKLIPAISRVYLSDKCNPKKNAITSKMAGDIFVSKFVGRINEHIILMLLDRKQRMLFCGVICEGNIHYANVNIRKIIEIAINYNSGVAILAHNHPSGIAIPSKEDIYSTIQIKKALNFVGINLIDHFIVSDSDYVSLADSAIDEIF